MGCSPSGLQSRTRKPAPRRPRPSSSEACHSRSAAHARGHDHARRLVGHGRRSVRHDQRGLRHSDEGRRLLRDQLQPWRRPLRRARSAAISSLVIHEGAPLQSPTRALLRSPTSKLSALLNGAVNMSKSTTLAYFRRRALGQLDCQNGSINRGCASRTARRADPNSWNPGD